MSQRLLLRRVWALSTRDLRLPLPVCSTSSSSLLHSCSSSSPLLLPAPSSRHMLPRPFHHTACRQTSFNVQNHDDFTERVINSELPVLILGPRLEKAVAKQKGRVAMAKVDIDDHTDLALEYGVSAVPTVIAIRGGDVIDQFVGIKDADQLDSFVSKLIGQ
ncbi:hypothetical protein CRUP_011637 [Coryphaenoides rupestris]|nr:hypothetical protein CRUP_011637 [Coryphaenoides rupestris]